MRRARRVAEQTRATAAAGYSRMPQPTPLLGRALLGGARAVPRRGGNVGASALAGAARPAAGAAPGRRRRRRRRLPLLRGAAPGWGLASGPVGAMQRVVLLVVVVTPSVWCVSRPRRAGLPALDASRPERRCTRAWMASARPSAAPTDCARVGSFFFFFLPVLFFSLRGMYFSAPWMFLVSSVRWCRTLAVC